MSAVEAALARLLDVASEVGRARQVLALHDEGKLDCAATVERLRTVVERVAEAVKVSRWPR